MESLVLENMMFLVKCTILYSAYWLLICKLDKLGFPCKFKSIKTVYFLILIIVIQYIFLLSQWILTCQICSLFAEGQDTLLDPLPSPHLFAKLCPLPKARSDFLGADGACPALYPRAPESHGWGPSLEPRRPYKMKRARFWLWRTWDALRVLAPWEMGGALGRNR